MSSKNKLNEASLLGGFSKIERFEVKLETCVSTEEMKQQHCLTVSLLLPFFQDIATNWINGGLLENDGVKEKNYRSKKNQPFQVISPKMRRIMEEKPTPPIFDTR
jgi:hypothetical protein